MAIFDPKYRKFRNMGPSSFPKEYLGQKSQKNINFEKSYSKKTVSKKVEHMPTSPTHILETAPHF